MARRGRFGRVPRPAQDLTRLVVSIAREMQAQRDKNLMDAWEKGGTFEGKKATDEMVLAHWRERMKGIDKDDPLYEAYKNTLSQYEYAIAESKASTAYAQGKLTDRQMAQFYLNWAKKVPKNSEFYRVLQRDAAQFMRAARSRGSASASKAKEEAYQKSQEHTYNQYEKTGDYITEVMRQVARANALIGADPDSDLSQFDPTDPAKMLRLLDAITVGTGVKGRGPEAGSDEVLYHDPLTGKAVTGADVVAQLQKIDPHFDGRVTLDYVRSVISRQREGQGIRLDRAEKTGHTTDANNLKKWQQYTGEIARETNLWPVQQQYQSARSTFLTTWLSQTASPDSKLAAWQEYSASLTRIAGGSGVDDNTRSRIMAEIEGDGSVQSLAEDFTGLSSTDQATTTGGFQGDIAETHLDLERYFGMQQAVAAGAAVWTPGYTDDQGVFVPQPGGAELGAATVAQIQQASPVAPVVIFVPQSGAKTIPVVVSGATIKAVARNELGEDVTKTDANPVGSYYDVKVGGFSARVYSFTGGDGHTYYSTSTPWDDDGVQARETPEGLQLDLSAYVPRKDANGQWSYANGTAADVQSGTGAFGLSEPNQQGEQRLVMNPSRAVYTSDPARATAGIDPATDFFSPTLAALMSSPEGMKTLSSLRDDPAFQQQLQFEAQYAATDKTTGQVDAALLGQYQGQLSTVTKLPDSADGLGTFIRESYALWDRVTTSPTFRAADAAPTGGPSSFSAAAQRGGTLPTEVTKLPSDQVRGTEFGALGDIFQAGTNLLRNIFGEDKGNLSVRLAGQIKVPDVPTITPTPTPAPAPAPTTAPVSTTVGAAPSIAPVTTTAPPSTFSAPSFLTSTKVKNLGYQ
jgi:hypothetical protein